MPQTALNLRTAAFTPTCLKYEWNNEQLGACGWNMLIIQPSLKVLESNVKFNDVTRSPCEQWFAQIFYQIVSEMNFSA